MKRLTLTLLVAWCSFGHAQERRPSIVPVAIASAAMTAAAGLDLASTLACRDCTEVGPVGRLAGDPQHPAGLAVLVAGEVVGVTLFTNAMRRSDKPLVRRLWWIPAAVVTAAHLWAAEHNRGLRP